MDMGDSAYADGLARDQTVAPVRLPTMWQSRFRAVTPSLSHRLNVVALVLTFTV
jgi:hypothetical protein